MFPACLFFFCWFVPPASVPDGAGGFVPFTNSRVMPDGSLRPYDPAVDGVPAAEVNGPYPAIIPMPAYFFDQVPGAIPKPDPLPPNSPPAATTAGKKAITEGLL